MKIKGIVEEDFVNFNKPSMLLLMPSCNWKCGQGLCQNSSMAKARNIDAIPKQIALRYANNPITKALIFSGLEPMLSFEDVVEMIVEFRKVSEDEVVIYTGYTEEEVKHKIKYLQENFKNIIVKFGRYTPDEEVHCDSILGVNLASNNQYAKKIC